MGRFFTTKCERNATRLAKSWLQSDCRTDKQSARERPKVNYLVPFDIVCIWPLCLDATRVQSPPVVSGCWFQHRNCLVTTIVRHARFMYDLDDVFGHSQCERRVKRFDKRTSEIACSAELLFVCVQTVHYPIWRVLTIGQYIAIK